MKLTACLFGLLLPPGTCFFHLSSFTLSVSLSVSVCRAVRKTVGEQLTAKEVAVTILTTSQEQTAYIYIHTHTHTHTHAHTHGEAVCVLFQSNCAHCRQVIQPTVFESVVTSVYTYSHPEEQFNSSNGFHAAVPLVHYW